MFIGRYRVRVYEFEWLVNLYRLPFKFGELSRPYLNLMAEYAEGLIRHERISFEEIKLDYTTCNDNYAISNLQGDSVRVIITNKKHPLLFNGYQEIDRFERTQIISILMFKACKIYIDDPKDIRLLTLREVSAGPMSEVENENDVKESTEHTNLKGLYIDLDTESVLDIDKC